MKARVLLQVIALVLAILLVAALTLAIVGKVSLFTFWLLIVFTAFVSWLLHESHGVLGSNKR